MAVQVLQPSTGAGKRVRLLAGVLILLAAAACVQPDSSVQAEEQRALAAEDAYVEAEIQQDEDALRNLVDDRFTFNSPNGTTSGKEQLIGTVLAMNMTDQIISERSVMIEGDLAIIFGTTEMHFQPAGADERRAHYRYTSVYVKRSDQWRLLALQMMPRS